MDMYMEEILDHYKHPHNKGSLKNPAVHMFDSNPLCGDEQEVFIKINNQEKINKDELSNQKITEIAFTGRGCAISIAATSMLTDELKGKKLEEVLRLQNDFVFNLLNVHLSPMRVKCALLGLKLIQKAIIKTVGGENHE